MSTSEAASPAYLASRKVIRPTGLASTVSAVPMRISWATLADAHSTEASSPESNVTASVLSFTSLGSSPNPK